MTDFSNTNKNSNPDSATEVKEFYNKFFTTTVSYPANQIDAVIGFFTKRGFDQVAAIAVATAILQQAKIENVNVFTIIDTLEGLTSVQLSDVVTQVLNSSRSKISTLGYRNLSTPNTDDIRNILI
jgi:hypothetical protein